MILAASNAFGMILLVVFMAYGVTAIPRNLWRYKNYKLKLKKCQFDASMAHHKKISIVNELELQCK